MSQLFEKGFDGRRRNCLFAGLSLLIGGLFNRADSETGRLDPEFSKLPFESWLSEGEHTSAIDWSADILPAAISTHQRLMLRIVIRVAGASLAKRKGAGELVTLVQYKDGGKAIWQNHTSLDLAKLAPGIETHQIAIAQYAFVLPGDYSLAIAVCDTTTLEHSVIFREVHVDPLKPDPLPGAWDGLPAVEFIPPITDPPDVWYLPGIAHRLNLGVSTRRKVRIQLLVNATPSDEGSLSAMRTNMSLMIPALKVLSELDVRNGSIDVAFLDLTQRRVAFEQRGVRDPDWEKMRELLQDAKPGLVDVAELKAQAKILQFFRDEVRRRLVSSEPPGSENPVQIVIVLSGPAFLRDQEPLSPLEAYNRADARLFYIRFQVRLVPQPSPRKRRGAAAALPADDLQRAVEPMDARLYEATSAARFREILAAVLSEISLL